MFTVPKIQRLDSYIYNRIAAGEVVENPSSVIKELVENSIDAGASEIVIEIKNGGIDLIKVVDNGCGIEKDDVLLAFERHATSKIKVIEDLDAIGSLGFRGEALSSIAAVASVRLVSRTMREELGQTVHFDTGELIDRGEIGASIGTSIKVENLFLKIPARRQYLKEAVSEKRHINILMTKLILSNPSVAFKYIADEKLVYQSCGGGVEAALASVYGEDIEYFFKINKAASGIQIGGYAARPEYTKGNKHHQTLVVNGRFVICEDIFGALKNVLRDYLMTKRYPVYVIYLDIPLDMLDINVHPKKTEVKFVEAARIRGLICSLFKEKIKEMFLSVSDIFEDRQGDRWSDSINDTGVQNTIDMTEFADFSLKNTGYTTHSTPIMSNFAMNERPSRFDLSGAVLSGAAVSVPAAAAAIAPTTPAAPPMIYDNDGIKIDISSIKQLGTLFNTYILIEKGESFYLIDQHAAHERLLYNKFKSELENATIISQPLLVPYQIDEDSIYFVDALKKLGFEIDGNTILAVPLVLCQIELGVFIGELANEGMHYGQLAVLDFIKERIIQSACKAAVKAGDSLSSLEIEALFNELAKEQELCCPHGRPLIVKMSKKEIDKLFKRVL